MDCIIRRPMLYIVEQECGDKISIATIYDPNVDPTAQIGGHNLTLELQPNGGG